MERTHRADAWEAAADERERLADERETVGDEREWLADERDRLLDQHEHGLDRFEASLAGDATSADVAALRSAVGRPAGPGRAGAQAARDRQAGARAEARVLRVQAAQDRTEAARERDAARDVEEEAWLLDRRDFVAAERDRLSDERDGSADRRDDASDQREGLTDERDAELGVREQRLRSRKGGSRRTGITRLTPGADRLVAASRRAQDRARRAQAADQRQAAAQDRRGAAAQWGPEPFGPHLMASFAELARHLFATDDPDATLAQVLDYAVAVVPNCEGASLTVWRHASLFETLATSRAAAQLDQVQFSSRRGPAFEAMADGSPLHVPDLAHDPRWPALAETAKALGVSEVLCYGLQDEGDRSASASGSFTLSSGQQAAFGEQEREFGAVLAAFLAVAVAAGHRGQDIERREAALHRALSSRDVIGQAKGILMEREGLSAPEAFDVLRRASQRLNLRLTDLAEELVQTRQLPAGSGSGPEPNAAQPDG